jgi:O-Antigen ligase
VEAIASPQVRVLDDYRIASGTTFSDAVPLLQAFALAVMLVPSNTVIGPIGAPGYPGSLIGIFVFGVYGAAVLFGIHNPMRYKHPMQAVLAVLWVSVLASYVLMDRAILSSAQLGNADRLLIKIAVVTGVALTAAEKLRSLEDVRRVARALCWGGAACGFIAAVQYTFSYDLAQFARDLPGFTLNQDNPFILSRGSLNRATGTAVTPIELGVVAGMLLPLSIWLGLHDTDRRTIKRWAPAVLISMAAATSVSRSGILAIVAAFGLMVVLMPPVPRAAALCAVPFGVVGAFMTAHGLIGTLASFFSAGSSDSSIQYRTHDYPLAEAVWQKAPVFGHGGGTWIPVNELDIFDNQFLNTAVELGLLGVIALVAFLVVPAITALVARKRSGDPELRLLCAALAGAGLAAAGCSVTFDSLAFPMFLNVYALVIGLSGACWRLARAERPRAAP